MWDLYNGFLLAPDVDRMRKLLIRHDLFNLALNVPGDIVECGVFKGTGLMQWLKMLAIYSPGSNKKVIGFDLFEQGRNIEDQTQQEYFAEAGSSGVTAESLSAQIDAIGLRNRCELIEGDIAITSMAYANANPGFRISLLNMDLDLGKPTLGALDALWPRVVRGGVVVFDEYAEHRWSEAQGVDEFLNKINVSLRAIPHSKTPTGYVIKD